MNTTTTRRLEDVFTAAAVMLLLFMSMMSQVWVIGIALGLVIFGLIAFPQTRRLGMFALAAGIAGAATIAVALALR